VLHSSVFFIIRIGGAFSGFPFLFFVGFMGADDMIQTYLLCFLNDFNLLSWFDGVYGWILSCAYVMTDLIVGIQIREGDNCMGDLWDLSEAE